MGSESISEVQGVSFFPLITKYNEEGFYGVLESISVHLSKTAEKDKFIVVPSEREIEKKIDEQCKKSWLAAIKLAETYVKKLFKFHEVIINFERKEGFYEGNSLGIALTLSFLEELLKFYNPTYVIKIKGKTAFTGGLTEEGKVLSCGKEIIKQKVKAIFFSEMNSFVVPKGEENPAREQFLELQKEYPNRNLKLIPVEDIADVLNRRDLVEIQKQKLVVRTGKFVRKNWVSAVVTVLLAILFGYLFVMDWDDNPAILENDGTTLFVKNKKGKILWTEKLQEYPARDLGKSLLDNFVKIVDINSDGNNEVLICNLILSIKEYGGEGGGIMCLNKKGELIWKYDFRDTVFSEREDLPPPYYIELIDTLNENNRKQLLLFAINGPSYASAVFKLDLLTGKRIEGTHWTSGYIYESTLKDINNDKILDIILVGKDNGFGESVLWILSSNKIFGFRPSTDEYNIKNQPEADLIGYVRFPKTDYDIFNYPQTLMFYHGSIDDIQENGKIIVTLFVYNAKVFPNYNTAIIYKFSFDLKTVDVYIGDRFREARDSLVNSGKLNYPLTDTKEYRKALKDNLLYYKNGKWVKRGELE